MKKSTIVLIIALVFFTVLPFIASYYSLDSQIRNNGFEMREHSADPIDTAYHLNLTKVNVTNIDVLQAYAKNTGETMIFYNTYHISDYESVLSYYFVDESNSTIYFTQFHMIEDQPYPLQIVWPAFVGVGISLVLIVALLSLYYYLHPEALSTQQQSRSKQE